MSARTVAQPRGAHEMTGYTYLASPYSAPTLQIRVSRFMVAQDATIWMLKTGKPVYCPIQVWHHIKELKGLDQSYEYFKRQNDAMLYGAKRIAVLCIPGWKESKGIQYELKVARKLDMRCFLMQLSSPQLDKHGFRLNPEFTLIEQEFKTWTPASVLSK